MDDRSIRRTGLVVAAVLLVALAGCSGLSGETTPTDNSTDTPAENMTGTPAENMTGTPAENMTGTPADNTSVNSSEGNETEGNETDTNETTDVEGADLDGAALNAATTAAVEDAGSYTLETTTYQTSETDQGESIRRLDTTVRVDLDADEGIRQSNSSFQSQPLTQNSSITVYTDGNMSYQERITGGETNYSAQEGEPTSVRGGIRPVNTDSFTQNFTFVTSGVVWEENGTETIDGDSVTRYTLAGFEESNGNSDATITDSTGTLLVDDSDAIRYIELGVTTQSDSGTSTVLLQYRLTDIGSTTVEEPDWLEQAQSS